MPKQSSAIILCSKDEFEARAKRVIDSTTNYKVVTRSALEAMKKVTKIYHAKNNGGSVQAKEAYDEFNAQEVVIPLQWNKFRDHLRKENMIIRSGALYFKQKKVLAFEDYHSRVQDMIQQEFSGELTKSNLEKVKTNLLKQYHMQAELLNCFNNPIEPVEDPASPLVISENYFSNQIKSLSNEHIDLEEKFKMGIQINNSIRDKFQATLDESRIDSNFLDSFSERIKHLLNSLIESSTLDESFDLDHVSKDALKIFEALSTFELFEDMNKKFTALFHCIPTSTFPKLRKTFKLKSLWGGMADLLHALKQKSFVAVLVSDISYSLGISCAATNLIRTRLNGGNLPEPMYSIAQALFSPLVTWNQRESLISLLLKSGGGGFSYSTVFQGGMSSFVNAILSSGSSTTFYATGVVADNTGNTLICRSNQKCMTNRLANFLVWQLVLNALGCYDVFHIDVVLSDRCRVEFMLAAKEYGLLAAMPLKEICKAFIERDDIKEIHVGNHHMSQFQVIPFDLALTAVLQSNDLTFTVLDANVSLSQQRQFSRSCACLVFCDCSFDKEGEVLLGLTGFNHECETRRKMCVEFN